MTDNRTTDLREKLTEHGIEYQAIGKRLTYWNRDGSHNDYDDADFVADEQNGYLIVEGLTPEQAIAATLGEPGVLYMRGQPGTDYAAITTIEVDGQRFERVRECELEHHETGWVSCRECNTSWKNDRPHVYRRCPYCGARVKEGGE